MKRILALVALISVLVLAACGGNNNNNANDAANNNAGNDNGNASEPVELKVGASSVPHAEILEEAAPLLEEKGINLTIEEYEDYVLPNDDLETGDLDANYFQHIPYLDQTVEDTGYALTHIGGVHIEPIGVYSKDVDSIEDIEEGTEVVLSNSVADHGRVLQLFEANDLITLKDGVEEGAATLDDIEDNPKNLTFSPDYEPRILPEIYESEEGILTVINTNYAIEGGLTPNKHAIVEEEDDSPYVNVIAVQEERKDDEALQTLLELLRSDEIQDFIVEKYEGAVVPVSN